MALLQTYADTKIFIGGKAPDKLSVTAADFAGTSWVEIKGLAVPGAVGDTQAITEQEVVSESRMLKAKGIRNAGSMENQFVPMPLDPGQIALQAAIDDDCDAYEFKVEYGASCTPQSTVTITNGSDADITWTAHGLVAGQPVIFSTTGSLPTGLTAGTVYYVIATGLTANTFKVSATKGGSAITTSSAGSGTHTADAPPVGKTRLFYALAHNANNPGGGSSAAFLLNTSLAITTNIVSI